MVSWDVMTHDIQPGRLAGIDDELVSTARLDNLLSCWAAVQALLDVAPGDAQIDSGAVAVVVLFDHEEIGSTSSSGADSDLLPTTLERIVHTGGGDRDAFLRAVAASRCVSADGAHATHPNYAERHDADHPIALNGGPVIKHNANVRYATDARHRGVVRGRVPGGRRPGAALRVPRRHAVRVNHRADHRRTPRHHHRRRRRGPTGHALVP